jgi:hypothetical protein
MLFAAITVWLWIHSTINPRSSEGLSNVNTLVLRPWRIAIGSWRGRLAIGHMDNPKYKYWNSVPALSYPHCSGASFLGGMVDYQACDDGSASWDFDFDWYGSYKHGPAWRFAGFAYASHSIPHDLDIPISVGTVCFAIPDYFVVLLLLIFPAIWFRRRHIAARRRKDGLCATCGYDLRAGHSACPECGAQTVPDSAASQRGGNSPSGFQKM